MPLVQHQAGIRIQRLELQGCHLQCPFLKPSQWMLIDFPHAPHAVLGLLVLTMMGERRAVRRYGDVVHRLYAADLRQCSQNENLMHSIPGEAPGDPYGP